MCNEFQSRKQTWIALNGTDANVMSFTLMNEQWPSAESHSWNLPGANTSSATSASIQNHKCNLCRTVRTNVEVLEQNAEE